MILNVDLSSIPFNKNAELYFAQNLSDYNHEIA